MSGRSTNRRNERETAADQLEPQAPVLEDLTSGAGAGSGRSSAFAGSDHGRENTDSGRNERDLAGVVGDASTTGLRSGDDARRRGWFWHWNNIVTQYAPMIGLKGVGLINSYTVWTDRRDTSPHRGYAFPSQQSEADFYGEDRAELITINKILVALDLIEIRKEMVLRVDVKGRRWKVPHNFYRVKDHDDGFALTSCDVMKVATLADKDRTVYRYLRRMFSPKFSPIDSQNVWHDILKEARENEVWQRLAIRALKDESKASARSIAGHATRRSNDAVDFISLPTNGDIEEPVATAVDISNDSVTAETERSERQPQTIVAKTNSGLRTSDDRTNNGFDKNPTPSDDEINTAGETTVQRTNSTYYQSLTTTTTDGRDAFATVANEEPGGGLGYAPDESRSEAHATRLFEEANDRISTPAERRLLRQLAAQFDPLAARSGHRGWTWLACSIDDAVAAGSTFVAPRRMREILTRWSREGMPEEYAGRVPNSATPSQSAPQPVTRQAKTSHNPSPRDTADSSGGAGRAARGDASPEGPFVAPAFTVEACGMSNRQIWSAVLSDLQSSGLIGRAEVETWLRDAAVIGVSDEGGLVLGVPHELAWRRTSGRYLASIRQSVQRVTGLSLAIEVVLFRDWPAA